MDGRLFVKSIGFAGWCMLTACMLTSVYAGENSQNKVIEISNAELAVVLGATPSPAEKRVTELLAERIKDRTGIALAESEFTF